jgi:hypothetical protein
LPLIVAENAWLKVTLGEPFYDRRLEFGDEPCVWTEQSLGRLREVLGTSTPVLRSLVSSHLEALIRTDRAGTTPREFDHE